MQDIIFFVKIILTSINKKKHLFIQDKIKNSIFILQKVLKKHLNLILKPYSAFKIWILNELN